MVTDSEDYDDDDRQSFASKLAFVSIALAMVTDSDDYDDDDDDYDDDEDSQSFASELAFLAMTTARAMAMFTMTHYKAVEDQEQGQWQR